MEKTLLFLLSYIVTLWTLVSAGSLVIRPDNTNPFVPVCTSYSGLCHIAYNVSEAGGRIWHSDGQVCICPGQQRCPTRWTDTDNSIVKIFKNLGQEMEVKISYCHLDLPEEVCRFDTPAVVMRGNGPFLFEIAEDFQCKCNRRLYANRSWRLGDYIYTEYNCGKPRCIMNSSDQTCIRQTYEHERNVVTNEYICRCRRHEECFAPQILPTVDHPVQTQVCQPVLHRRRPARN